MVFTGGRLSKRIKKILKKELQQNRWRATSSHKLERTVRAARLFPGSLQAATFSLLVGEEASDGVPYK